MRRRRYRVANIAVLALTLAVMVTGVWWREQFGPNVVASLAGLIGFVSFLLFQVLYDTQAEVANTATNARIDLHQARIQDRFERLEARLVDLESGRTPPHGTPIVRP